MNREDGQNRDRVERRAGWRLECSECVPFQVLDGRVGRMEERVGSVETKVDALSRDFRTLSSDVRKVLHFFTGNGEPEKGWAHRGLVLESRVNSASRVLWIIVGVVVTSGVLVLGKVLLDAAKQGALG